MNYPCTIECTAERGTEATPVLVQRG
uniref:Uncharacterized protein n=1 Tax=Anguilla anguilla TaxID=7936 RepID=A0A0E9VT08_ANGAN